MVYNLWALDRILGRVSKRESGRQEDRGIEIRRLRAIWFASTFLAVTKADKVDQAR